MSIKATPRKAPFPTTIAIPSGAHGTSLVASGGAFVAQKSGTIDRLGFYKANPGTGTVEGRIETLILNKYFL
jgi:hypothetical protein